MIRINLLPPEIGQKRKDEKRWQWIALGGVIAVALVAGVFVVLQIQVSGAEREVASFNDQAAAMQLSSNQFKVFSQKQSELQARKQMAEKALAGRIDWSRLCGDIALVLPSDIYVDSLKLSEPSQDDKPGQITITGKAIDYPNDIPDQGYKSVAKLLVRLADLQPLRNVWMSSAEKSAPAGGSGATQGSSQGGIVATTANQTPYITFAISAEVGEGTSTTNPSAAPAPAQ